MNVVYADPKQLKQIARLDFKLTDHRWDRGFDGSYCILIKGKVVAYINCSGGYLYRLGVDPSYRGNGFAKRLLEYAEIHTANVFEYHVDLQMFLKSQGYKYVETLKYALQPGGNSYLFKKEDEC